MSERRMHRRGKEVGIGKKDGAKRVRERRELCEVGKNNLRKRKREREGRNDSEAERERRARHAWRKRTEAGRGKERPMCIREGRNMTEGRKSQDNREGQSEAAIKRQSETEGERPRTETSGRERERNSEGEGQKRGKRASGIAARFRGYSPAEDHREDYTLVAVWRESPPP